MDMASELRNGALGQDKDDNDFSEHFKAAQKSLDHSIRFNERYLNTDTVHVKYGTRVVLYNLACAYARKAQYRIEESMCFQEKELRQKLAKASTISNEADSLKESEALWEKEIATVWRQNYPILRMMLKKTLALHLRHLNNVA